MAKLLFDGPFQLLDSNGDPISGGKLQFDESGTSTPANIYTDNALSVAHTNPVIADTAGRVAAIYLQAIDYKMTVKDASDAVIDTIDPLHGVSAENTVKSNEANTFTKTQTWTKGADVASATALTLGDGNWFDVTGTVTITSIATKGIGTLIKLHFDAALTLTHEATDLVLPNGENITTAAGDEAEFYEYALGDWRLTKYLVNADPVYRLPSITKAPGEMSNGTDADHDIDIVAGTWLAQDADERIVLAATTIAIDASGNGGILDSETLDADTTYHVLSGRNTSDGAFVAGFKKTIVKPTDWDFFRRHGSVITDSSSNILDFFQSGDEFFWTDRANDFTASNPGTSAVTRAIRVPNGLEFLARLSFSHIDNSAASTTRALVSSLDATDQTPSTTAFTTVVNANGGVGSQDSAETLVKTNTSAQIRTRNSASAADITVVGSTIGWIDSRGRNA